jgi:hypothetical protein
MGFWVIISEITEKEDAYKRSGKKRMVFGGMPKLTRMRVRGRKVALTGYKRVHRENRKISGSPPGIENARISQYD